MLRDGSLTQITRDDTFVQSLVDEGRITAEQAHTHPQRSLIMPDLAGLTEAQALAALQSAGWTGTAAELTATREATLDPLMVGRVVNQTQPAGSEISKSDTVTISIGALGIPGR